MAELQYGVAKSRHIEKNLTALLAFVSGFDLLDFDSTDAEVYGQLRVYLERKGSVIGPDDLQIAAQAICRGLVLVTNNVREFSRIPQLRLENWI